MSDIFFSTHGAAYQEKKIEEEFEQMRQSLGCRHISYVASFQNLKIGLKPTIIVTYPKPWIIRYVIRNYGAIDPLVRDGLQRMAPFDWSDLLGRDPDIDAFFTDAAEHGIGPVGISIPCTSRDTKVALVSYTFDVPPERWPALRRSHLPDWVTAANILHQTVLEAEGLSTNPTKSLTEREKECLTWAALGKTDEDIAAILGISRWTVVAHFQSAKFKLKALNRTGAVAAALHAGVISLS